MVKIREYYQKKEKKRQGRSKENRERIKNLPPPDYTEYKCKNSQCGSIDNFIEDRTSGDLICTDCGFVREERGMADSRLALYCKTISKPYEKVVHFQQRLSRLIGKGPKIEKSTIKILQKEIETFHSENESTLGKRTILSICKKLKIDKKISDHWIQVRKRLGIYPYPEKRILNDEIKRRLRIRYICVVMAFYKTLYSPNESSRTNYLQRKNIYSLNHIISGLIRLEDEELYFYFAPYLPQLSGLEQTEINNKRWKIIVEFCAKNYSYFVHPKTGENYYFSWTYKPITSREILEHFTQFF